MALARKELGGKSWLDYDPAWLDAEAGSQLHQQLVEEVSWERRPITVFGKEVLQPRLIGWAGDKPYKYSGQVLEPRAFGPALQALLDRVNAETGLGFDHVLLNRYRDGADHMGMHADDEPELGEDPQIAALSLGAKRKLVFEPKPKKLRKKKLAVPLDHGSLLVMGGRIQHAWRHGVPKALRVEEERVNVTFRKLVYLPGEAPKPTRRGPPRPVAPTDAE